MRARASSTIGGFIPYHTGNLDLPNILLKLDNIAWSRINSGKPTTIAGYGITDGITTADVVTTATANKILKLNASSLLPAGITGNAATATTLATARNFSLTGDATAVAISFTGAADVALVVVLANSGVTAGTYKSVTVDAKGRVTAGTNPTTLADYGITDACTSTQYTDLATVFMGARNINLIGGGEMRWGMVTNTFSWTKSFDILPGGGRLVPGGALIKKITIATGSVALAAVNDCAYITIPTADAQTVTISVAQASAITGNDKLILAWRDSDNCLELLGGGWIVYGTIVEAGGKRDNYISKSVFTAANDFIVGTGSGTFAKKTLEQTQTILGIDKKLGTSDNMLTGAIDLNSYSFLGIWTVGDATSITNLPRGAYVAGDRSWGILVVTTVGSYIKQEFSSVVQNRHWVRVRTEATWTLWTELSQEKTECGTVTGLDANTMSIPGFYRVTNMVNPPTGYAAGNNDFFLRIIRLGDNTPSSYTYLRQELYDVRTSRSFTRSVVSGTFDVWREHIIGRGGINVAVIDTAHGSVSIGAENAGFCHIQTSLPAFYMNKSLNVAGEIYASAGYNKKVIHEGDINMLLIAGSFTLAESHNHKTIYIEAAGAVTITIPAGLSANFECTIIGYAGGCNITFVASGTNLYSPGSKRSITAICGMVYVRKYCNDAVSYFLAGTLV